MDISKTVNITSNLLNDLEKSGRLLDLPTERDFFEVIKYEKVIIYFLVNWSGPERLSRFYVYKALDEIDSVGTPAFKIDCSCLTKQSVVDWLTGQRENGKNFYYGGWGETLLISKGEILDVIKNPAQIGFKGTKEKLQEWK